MNLEHSFITDIKNILQSARGKAYTAVNFAMVEAYWNICRRIVEEEQKGKERAEYGTFLIRELSRELSSEFATGFNESNLRNFRQFYFSFSTSQIRYPLRSESQITKNEPNAKQHATGIVFKSLNLRKELTWTHCRLIMRIGNANARQYYIKEAADNNWSTRALQRNINTLYYERILSAKSKKNIQEQAANFDKQSPADFIKDPYIFEFLNIDQPLTSNEYEIEAKVKQTKRCKHDKSQGKS